MTTTEIELHVYITAEDDHRRIAVVDGTLPYIRPTVDDLWHDQQRVRRPAPLAGRVYVSSSATASDIAAEVAYLALTIWPAPPSFPWDRMVFARGHSTSASRSSSGTSVLASALADLHAVGERHLYDRGLATVITVNTKIDISAAVDAAHRRSWAELELERAACLSDEGAVAWLDGDRSALGGLLVLARAAGVRLFGVYAGETELLDTIIVSPPPVEHPIPSMDLSERRWRASRGEPVFLSRDEILAIDPRERRGPAGVTLDTMRLAVRRGWAEWIDGMESALRPTELGESAAGRLPEDVRHMFSQVDHRGLIVRPKIHEPRPRAFVDEEQVGECMVFRSYFRDSEHEHGASSAAAFDIA